MPRVARGAATSSNQRKKKKNEDEKDDTIEETKEENKEDFLPHQTEIREKYESDKIQLSVAVLIFLNFITSAIAAQLVPKEDTIEEKVFYIFEVFYAVVFGLELIWNLYGSWFSRFWRSGWNIFDFVIVIIAVLGLAMRDLPGISVLRLFRAFRVFRLFRRIKCLKAIIDGVIASIPGVANGFMVLLIIMGIWSIMGTEFYGNIPGCDQEFGDFIKSLFSMWQIMSGDSWASGIARKVIFENHLPFASIFFISFIMISSIIMLNVILAIFFEKYLGETEECETNTISMPNFDEASREQLLVLLTDVLSTENLQKLDEDDIQDLTKIISTHSETTFSVLLAEAKKKRRLSDPPSGGGPNIITKGIKLVTIGGNSNLATTNNTVVANTSSTENHEMQV